AHIPYNQYTAKLTPDQLDSIKGLAFISSVRVYGPEDTGPTTIPKMIQPMMDRGELISGRELKMVTYDIVLHQKIDLEKVLQWLKSHSVNIAGASEKKIRLYLLENSPLLGQISTLPEVALIQVFVPQELHNDISRSILGIDSSTNLDL